MVRFEVRILSVAVCLFAMMCPSDAAPRIPDENTDKQAKQRQVDSLIRQLGHETFVMREAAEKQLRDIGEPALEALRKAAKAHESAEIRRRAERLVEAIEPKPVKLASAYFSPGLQLPECKDPVYSITVLAQVNARGEGRGRIELITTPPNYDEYGDFVTGTEVDQKARPPRNARPTIGLDCTIEFVKQGFVGRVNTPSINRSVFRIKGPKITSALIVATPGPGLTSGRLLVLHGDERVEHVIELNDLTPRPGTGGGLPIPCHPGCFPAGTLVCVPGGTTPIERIRAGDWVTSVDADGKQSPVKVTGVSVTRNRLLEVRTEDGKLRTTQTQPVGLEADGFRAAGDLKAGDRVWRCVNGERRAVKVLDISPADGEANVYNLVLGGPKGFIAGDFVVRSKPPAD